jgi:tetratricopeptide (TPR) repeat protein
VDLSSAKTHKTHNQSSRRVFKTDTMEAIDSAISLNNDGVSLLVAGDDQAAAVALSHALSLVKGLLSLSLTRSCDLRGPSLASFGSSNDNKLPSCSSTMEVCEEHKHEHGLIHSRKPLPCLQDISNFFIYNHTMSISSDSPLTNEMLPIYSACAILNLALAYHRRGKQGHSIPCMLKAEKMYATIEKLLKNDGMNSNATATVLRIAAANNLSQIRFQRGEYERAREDTEFLAYLIRDVGKVRALLSDEELNGLLCNVVLFTRPNFAAAA